MMHIPRAKERKGDYISLSCSRKQRKVGNTGEESRKPTLRVTEREGGVEGTKKATRANKIRALESEMGAKRTRALGN